MVLVWRFVLSFIVDIEYVVVRVIDFRIKTSIRKSKILGGLENAIVSCWLKK